MTAREKDMFPNEDGLKLPGGPPLDATDAEIAAAVREAALLPLVLSVVHITGSMDLLRELPPTKPPRFSADASGGVPEEIERAIRERAETAIRGWRDTGCPPAHMPGDADIREMIDALTGAAIAPDYLAMLKEEAGLAPGARDLGLDGTARDDWSVLVIGAGLSGIVMGYRLRQAGIPFTIVEKNDGPGGTWYENRYPGARVDVPSHAYSFSFMRGYRWPELFSSAPVLRDYFADAVEAVGIGGDIRYRTEVTSLVWDDDPQIWRARLRTPDGEEEVTARAVVSAVGQLNRPAIPAIPGAETFAGPRHHSAQWREDIAVEGKRVAVIGTASTAMQLVPALAEKAAELTVFQRTPGWAVIHPEYRRPIRDGEHWAMEHLPGYAGWFRVVQYNWAVDGAPHHLRIDPDWPQDGSSISKANLTFRDRLVEGMRREIGDDSTLIEKVLPSYPAGVKRLMISDGSYFRCLREDHVTLETAGIERITETGVRTLDGKEYEVDIIVYATGFRAIEFLSPMEVQGKDGLSLNEFWRDEPGAYLGITVPNFPNLFLMYGPGTNLAFNGNLFFNGECQANFIGQCLKWMIEDDIAALEPLPEGYRDYMDRMQAELASFSWSHPGAGNWYRNTSGKVVTNSPWPLVEYWKMTRNPDRGSFKVSWARTAEPVSAG